MEWSDDEDYKEMLRNNLKIDLSEITGSQNEYA